MQLTELLFQKVKDLTGQGQLSLKPGYVAVVSKAPSLRAAILAPVCPAPGDVERLAGDGGPTRVGVGLLSGDGSPYRLLRELGGQRQLLRYDRAAKKFDPVTDDPLEIDSFLRVQCGMPPADAYTGFFVLEVDELPSARGKAAGGGEPRLDAARVNALKQELEATRNFEAAQDRLFKVGQRLHDLQEISLRLQEAEQGLAAVEAELRRTPWSAEETKELTAKAARAKEDLKKRDDALADIARRRERMQEEPAAPQPFLSNPWFYGGILAGAGLDALAFVLKTPFIALFGLVPFLAAAVAVLRFIEVDEAGKEATARAQELKEREASVRKSYEAEQAPLRAALKAARVDAPDDLLAVFRTQEAVAKRRQAALERLEKVKADPDVSRAAAEIPLLQAEKAKLEEQVQATGFSRPVSEIEEDLERATGISRATPAAVPEAEVPKQLVSRAKDLLGLSPEQLWAQLSARFDAYLLALTDKRVVSGKLDEKGALMLVAPDGRSGSYMTLPPPLRDLVYVALRLSLLERVGGLKRLPIVVDDAFGLLDAPKRALIGKMLKGISTQTQVIHRVGEAPAAGTADVVLSA